MKNQINDHGTHLDAVYDDLAEAAKAYFEASEAGIQARLALEAAEARVLLENFADIKALGSNEELRKARLVALTAQERERVTTFEAAERLAKLNQELARIRVSQAKRELEVLTLLTQHSAITWVPPAVPSDEIADALEAKRLTDIAATVETPAPEKPARTRRTKAEIAAAKAAEQADPMKPIGVPLGAQTVARDRVLAGEYQPGDGRLLFGGVARQTSEDCIAVSVQWLSLPAREAADLVAAFAGKEFLEDNVSRTDPEHPDLVDTEQLTEAIARRHAKAIETAPPIEEAPAPAPATSGPEQVQTYILDLLAKRNGVTRGEVMMATPEGVTEDQAGEALLTLAAAGVIWLGGSQWESPVHLAQTGPDPEVEEAFDAFQPGELVKVTAGPDKLYGTIVRRFEGTDRYDVTLVRGGSTIAHASNIERREGSTAAPAPVVAAEEVADLDAVPTW
jgi:hypothetical protein